MPDPRDILPRTVALLEDGIQKNLHVGAQVYVSRHGEPLADCALGQARPGVPMTPDTLMPWLSCTKPVGAVALARLWEKGALDLDDPVARHLPEFGQKGKEAVTFRHLLTHTGGFRILRGWREVESWDDIVARICEAPLEPGWTPGRKAGYHVAVSWYILAEIVRRIDGRPFERCVREDLFDPLNMRDSWIALPPERFRAYGNRLGLLYNTSGPAPEPILETEESAARCRPGSGGRGPIRELGRFYEMLLSRGSDILSPQTAEALTARHRTGMFDETFKHRIDWGLGFIVNTGPFEPGIVPYGFGRHASPRTFGHGGRQSSAAFADPEHGLVVALVTSGLPGEARHSRRAHRLHTAIYEDLGLVETSQ